MIVIVVRFSDHLVLALSWDSKDPLQ